MLIHFGTLSFNGKYFPVSFGLENGQPVGIKVYEPDIVEGEHDLGECPSEPSEEELARQQEAERAPVREAWLKKRGEIEDAGGDPDELPQHFPDEQDDYEPNY